ncbi:MAG: hypothetical protein AABW54_03965 [Candidatus Micrarchaeota archaeon]
MPEVLFKKLVEKQRWQVVKLKTNPPGKTPYIHVALHGHEPHKLDLDAALASAQKTSGVVIAYHKIESPESHMQPGGWTPARMPTEHSFTIVPKRGEQETAANHMAKAAEYLEKKHTERRKLLEGYSSTNWGKGRELNRA